MKDVVFALKDHLGSGKILDQAKLNELHPKAMAGDKEAMDRIVSSLMAWAISVATGIYNCCGKNRAEIDQEDLIQESFVGLLEGIQRFKPELGYRMTTYCYHYIRKSCLNYCYDNKLIRVPKYILARNKFKDRRQGPAFNEIFGEGKVQYIPSPETEIDFGVRTETYEKMEWLDNRAKDILLGKFLEGKTLAKLGNEWGMTRERVRQIVNESLEFLREGADNK